MKYCFFCLAILLYSCTQQDKTIKIKGSDTEVNLVVELAESFHNKNPDVFVSISGGGSGLGIASLLNNTADVANSSRTINKEEIAFKDALLTRLGASRELSAKAKNRIGKSSGKLAERLQIIFEKQDRKAARKAAELSNENEQS